MTHARPPLRSPYAVYPKCPYCGHRFGQLDAVILAPGLEDLGGAFRRRGCPRCGGAVVWMKSKGRKSEWAKKD